MKGVEDYKGDVATRIASDGRVLEVSGDPGYRVLHSFLLCAQSGGDKRVESFSSDQPYYPATLSLLAQLAAIEGQPTCVSIFPWSL